MIPAFTVVLGLVGLGGLVLLIRGLRGRRVGDEPRCRECGYNLTGLEMQRCPECGVAASRNVEIGRHVRRRGSLLLGAACVLLCGAYLGLVACGTLANVDWYSHLPLIVLESRAQGGDVAAIEELSSRVELGTLAPDALAGLVGSALRQQGLRPTTPAGSACAELLGQLELRRSLADDDRRCFYRQLTGLDLEFRSKVRQGEEFTLGLTSETYGVPPVGADWRVEGQTLRIGDTWERPLRLEGGETMGLNKNVGVATVGMTMSGAVDTDDLAPGIHEVRYEVVSNIYATLASGEPDFDDPIVVDRITLAGSLEILPAEAPDTLILNDDPRLGQALKQKIGFSWDASTGGDASQSGDSCTLVVEYWGPLPIAGAFDLFALVDRDEKWIDTIVVGHSDSDFNIRMLTVDCDDFQAGTFMPILRSNAELARKTEGLFEVWDGELRFDPIEILPLDAGMGVMTEDASTGGNGPL